jgi:hypothetical protein
MLFGGGVGRLEYTALIRLTCLETSGTRTWRLEQAV